MVSGNPRKIKRLMKSIVAKKGSEENNPLTLFICLEPYLL